MGALLLDWCIQAQTPAHGDVLCMYILFIYSYAYLPQQCKMVSILSCLKVLWKVAEHPQFVPSGQSCPVEQTSYWLVILIHNLEMHLGYLRNVYEHMHNVMEGLRAKVV